MPERSCADIATEVEQEFMAQFDSRLLELEETTKDLVEIN